MNIPLKTRLLVILQSPNNHPYDELLIQDEVLLVGSTLEKVAIINWLARTEGMESRTMWNNDSFEVLIKMYQRLN